MKTIHINLLDSDSVKSAVAELREVKSDWKNKANLVAKEVAGQLGGLINIYCSELPYTDELINLKTHTVESKKERKRSRLAEALITAMVVSSRADYHKQLRKFADLWHTQTKQYGEKMVDKTRINTFKKNGIKRVKWVTKEDEKVCKECAERDGKIYPIDKIPDKPHYNCRCWIVPLLEKGNNGK